MPQLEHGGTPPRLPIRHAAASSPERCPTHGDILLLTPLETLLQVAGARLGEARRHLRRGAAGGSQAECEKRGGPTQGWRRQAGQARGRSQKLPTPFSPTPTAAREQAAKAARRSVQMLKDVVAALCTGTGRMKPVLTTVGATVHRMRSSRFTGRATWWSTSRCAWSGSASSCWCDEGGGPHSTDGTG